MSEIKLNPNHLIDLVDCINKYYNGCWSEDYDPSEEWKRKANLINKAVPEDVDEVIKSAFIKQLEKFTN